MQPGPFPEEFELVVMNPAATGSMGDVQILQQLVPYQKASVSAKKKTDGDGANVLQLTTKNVRKISISFPPGSKERGVNRVEVDKVTLESDSMTLVFTFRNEYTTV